MEKANSILNKQLEEGNISDIGMLIIDEFHLLFEEGRGFIVEMLIAKAKAIKELLHQDIRIISMSATMKQADTLSNWLSGNHYNCDLRPVPLTEYIVIGEALYDKELKRIVVLPKSRYDSLTILSKIYLKCNESVIIFCPSKRMCETTANRLCKHIQQAYLPCSLTEKTLVEKIGSLMADDNLVDMTIIKARQVLCDELKATSVGLCPILAKTILYGIAYHNSDLTADERVIIEKVHTLYRDIG